MTEIAFFATAAKGTEPALRDELQELGLGRVRADRGGVHFHGDRRAGFRACLGSRIAQRVLTPVASFPCHDAASLYEGVRGFDWSAVLSPRHTLVVSAACRSSTLTHTEFVAQRTKDAIVDQQRDRHGARPSVDKHDADLRVFVHLVKDQATAYLDLAGESLHRRGWRRDGGEAPLKETLAAALLRLSGWDRRSPLHDPMCGSGTLLIEGALWAAEIAPGLSRERFGFERWADFSDDDARALRELREAARARIRRDLPELRGGDLDERALRAARENARCARVSVAFDQQPLHRASPTSDFGTLVANPPYGERLERSVGLARELTDLLDRFGHWRAALLLPESLRLTRARRHERVQHVFNGDLRCVAQVWGAR